MQVVEEKKPLSAVIEAFSRHKDSVQKLRTEPIEHRKDRLRKLRNWIHANRSKLHEAMYADFQKNPTEVDSIEVFHVLAEIKHALDNLEQLVYPEES